MERLGHLLTNAKRHHHAHRDPVMDPTNLYEAISQLGPNEDNVDVIKKYLQKNAEEDINAVQTEGPGSGLTGLHIAAHRGYVRICKLLLENGADVNKKSAKTGWTPLMYAVGLGYSKNLLRITKMLCLEYEADAHLKNKYGNTALNLAEKAQTRDKEEAAYFLSITLPKLLKAKQKQTRTGKVTKKISKTVRRLSRPVLKGKAGMKVSRSKPSTLPSSPVRKAHKSVVINSPKKPINKPAYAKRPATPHKKQHKGSNQRVLKSPQSPAVMSVKRKAQSNETTPISSPNRRRRVSGTPRMYSTLV